MARRVRSEDSPTPTRFTHFSPSCAVKGTLKEKEQAKDEYEDAIASGHGAYLLEQSSEESFTASIGNLPPGKEVIVWLTYVMELEFNDAGQLRIVLPEQKFAPDGVNTPTFPKPSTADAADNEQRVPAGLTMDVQFQMTSNITQIICESHPDVVKSEIVSGDPRRGSLRIPTTDKPLVVDLEILVQLEDASKLSAIVQKNDKGEHCAMVSFFPRLLEAEPLGEILFLVDRSGSMQGTKMKRTVDTMQIFLRSLSPGVRFNIVSFGSSFSLLFPQSKDYDEASLAEATKHVSTMSANMGGTEILTPLRSIFKKAADPKYPRQLFILTDGEVTDPSSCIRECKIAADSTRVFCFGIGSGASKKLVEGMALAANGDFEMVGDNDRIDDKVLKQLGKALVPAVSNIKITWPSGSVARTAPFRQVPVFAGGRVTSFAWLKPGQKTLSVGLSAVTPLEDIAATVEVRVEKPIEGDFVFALAARRLLKDFEESRSYVHSAAGALANEWTPERVKQEMIKVSVETGVMCEHTAFVAVEERDDATTTEMVRRRVVQEQLPESRKGGVTPASNSWGRGGARSGGAPASPRSTLGSAMPGAPMRQASSSGDGGGGARLSQKNSTGSADKKKRSKETVAKPSTSSSSSTGLFSFLKKDTSATKSKKMEEEKSESVSRRREVASKSDSSSASDDEASEDREASATPSWMAPAPAAAAAPAPSAPPKVSDGEISRMRETILKQTAVGNWKLADAAMAVKSSDADISAHFASIAGEFASGDKKDTALLVFASALVCAFFETALAAEKVTWQLVVKKARTWIAKQALKGVDWEAAAKAFLTSKKLV